MLEHQRITPEQYLAQVESAVRHLFDGIGTYLERYHRIHWPSQAKDRAELELGMKELAEWFAGQFSLSVLCGAVLQIAAQALEVCSTNSEIPPECEPFAQAEMARYCVGRRVHGLPIGTIVCAGRHQFAHWEEEHTRDEKSAGFSKFVEGVFHRLNLQHQSSLMDLVYDLGNEFYRGEPIRADSLMLTELSWTTYDRYLADMQDMLAVRGDRS
jgi:hypothetical protein